MSTTTIKNAQRTSKTREPSKDRQTKKDETQTKTIKTISKTKSDLATPSSNRSKSETTADGRISNRQPKKDDVTKISTRSSRVKKIESDKPQKASLKPKTLSSTRKDGDKTIKAPTSTRLKTDSNKPQISSRSKTGADKSSVRTAKVDSNKTLNSSRLKVSSRKPGSPSSRVKKTQYIPNTKKMMHNALKSLSKENSFVQEPASLDSSACDRPSFVEEPASLDSSTSERPRTATLRKGSIVNMNIAGPDVPKVKKKSASLDKRNSRDLKVKKRKAVEKIDSIDEINQKEYHVLDGNDEINQKGSEKNDSIDGKSEINQKGSKKTDRLDDKGEINQKESKRKPKMERIGSGDHLGSESRKEKRQKDVIPPKENVALSKNTLSKEKTNVDHSASESRKEKRQKDVLLPKVNVTILKDKEKTNLSNAKIIEGIDNFLRTKTPEEADDDDYNYEEDFDSYASDFDEYQSTSETTSDYTSEEAEISTSSSTTDEAETKPRINSAEEERKLDSGNFDLPEMKHKQILGNITETTELNNGSLSDEGFEEIKSLQFVNFLGAKKKRDFQRSQSRRNKRGEELLGMIRLDQRNFTLLDIPPVSYDTYIKSFGNRNSMQVTSQTHEDDVSEETQTESISSENKWTQFPIKFPKSANPGNLVVMNYKGVGGDLGKEIEQMPKFNEYNLAAFLRNSGQVVLALLEENEGLHLHNKDLARNTNIQENLVKDSTNTNENQERDGAEFNQKTQDVATNNFMKIGDDFNESHIDTEMTEQIPTSDQSFCDGGVLLCTDFLKPRKVSCLSFSAGGLLKLVSVHPPENGRDTAIEGFELKSVGCVWDPSDFAVPEDLFAGFGSVNCACFAATNNKVIFGGLKDGTVTLWDLLENQVDGGDYLEMDLRNSKTQVRITNTAKCTTEPDLGNGCAQIVAVHSIVDIFENSQKFDTQTTNNLQVLSLNEIGVLIIWGLISHGTHKGATLVKFSAFSLASANPQLMDLHCTDMCIDQTDPNHIYISTNYGYTLHCLVNGSKAKQTKYSPESTSKANSIEPCYHQKDCFLVGFENGNISLYTKSTEKPLTTFNNQAGDEHPVRMVQWSRNRPWIFYTTDSDKTINIWDLSFSGHFPSFSVSFENGIKMIKLSEPTNINNKRSYMAIISKNEKIHLHQLTGDHSRMSSNDYSKDLKVFTNYINRL